MQIDKLFLFLILIGLFSQCKSLFIESENNAYSQTKFKDGKCHSKVLVPDKTNNHSEEYAVYTGNELEEDVDIEIKKIIVKPSTTKWVKKKADRNCMSDNPDDCLVWCLVEVPEEAEEFKILLDTSQSKNYEIKNIQYDLVTDQGGYTAWIEVLCEKDLTKQLIGKIQNALKENNFYEGKITLVYDAETKNSLTSFQQENNLHVGGLDFETLDVLGIVVK